MVCVIVRPALSFCSKYLYYGQPRTNHFGFQYAPCSAMFRELLKIASSRLRGGNGPRSAERRCLVPRSGPGTY